MASGSVQLVLALLGVCYALPKLSVPHLLHPQFDASLSLLTTDSSSEPHELLEQIINFQADGKPIDQLVAELLVPSEKAPNLLTSFQEIIDLNQYNATLLRHSVGQFQYELEVAANAQTLMNGPSKEANALKKLVDDPLTNDTMRSLYQKRLDEIEASVAARGGEASASNAARLAHLFYKILEVVPDNALAQARSPTTFRVVNSLEPEIVSVEKQMTVPHRLGEAHQLMKLANDPLTNEPLRLLMLQRLDELNADYTNTSNQFHDHEVQLTHFDQMHGTLTLHETLFALKPILEGIERQRQNPAVLMEITALQKIISGMSEVQGHELKPTFERLLTKAVTKYTDHILAFAQDP